MCHLVFFENVFSASEEKGDAPNSGKPHNGVNYSAYEVCLTAEKPTYDIESKQTDASPVKSADYKQYE